LMGAAAVSADMILSAPWFFWRWNSNQILCRPDRRVSSRQELCRRMPMQLFVRNENFGVRRFDQNFTAYKPTVNLEFRNLCAVITQVRIVHPIPIEIGYEMQFGIARLDLFDWMIPISCLPVRAWILDHYLSVVLRNDVEEGHRRPKNVLDGPFSVDSDQYQGIKEGSLDSIEAINGIPVAQVRQGPKCGIPDCPSRYSEMVEDAAYISHSPLRTYHPYCIGLR